MTAIVITILLAYPMLVLHELSHCLVVWLLGGQVTVFKPWPHRAEGAWRIGEMRYRGIIIGLSWFGRAPLILDMILLAAGLVLRFPPLVTVAAVDAAWHFAGAWFERPGCDLDLWFDAADTPRRIAAVMTWVVLAGAVIVSWTC